MCDDFLYSKYDVSLERHEYDHYKYVLDVRVILFRQTFIFVLYYQTILKYISFNF